MNYEGFIREFFGYLRGNDKKCLKFIERNQKYIEVNFSRKSNPEIIRDFINEIKYAILHNKGNFKLYECILKSNLFEYIYSVFRHSDILVEACKNGHEEAVNWLVTMNINPYIQDKMGRSALMYAVQNEKLLSVVEKFGKNFRCVMLEDNEGNNALYYAIYNGQTMSRLLEVDINHLNQYHETVLMYCCRKDVYYTIRTLLDRKGVNINILNSEGKNLPMLLIEKLKIGELDYLRLKDYDLNFINEKGEGVLSTLIRQMYRKSQPLEAYSSYAKIIICLIKAGIDFNVVVDEDGNTALMAFLIARDYDTFNFLCRYAKNLDFKKKNNYGENATSLFLKLDLPPFQINPMLYQRSFDFGYVDQKNNNTALILTVINKPIYIEDVLQYVYSSIDDVNVHRENALIIAAKMNNYISVELLLHKCANANQQDDTGNSALHYAVRAKNIPMIYDLIHHGANPHLKNNEKESVLYIAQRSGNKKILDTLYGTFPYSEYIKEKSTMKRTRWVKIPKIDEYLYTNASNFYSEFHNNDARKKEIRNVYLNHIEAVNKNKQYINLRTKHIIDDILFYNITD